MFGKAVKVRHCPATVSAPAHLIVITVEGEKPARMPAMSGLRTQTTGSQLPGRWLEKAQVRRPVLVRPEPAYVPRGTKELQ
jgi:hypothetical protein